MIEELNNYIGGVYVEVLYVTYILIGVFYTIFNSESIGNKPTHVGDLILKLIFLPFSILAYSVYFLLHIADKIIDPIINSKWWNKKL